MIEQLPVQAGTRFPMVMNLVTRAVSGPLDIRGDHSDLYYGLNTGWVILTARSPQAVYDMNIMAARIAEHEDVRLPVIVAYDGFFTSHQKRRVHIFTNRETVQAFVGEKAPEYPHVLDEHNPIVVGAYMNGDDLMNNHYQQSNAIYRAGEVFKEVAEEYALYPEDPIRRLICTEWKTQRWLYSCSIRRPNPPKTSWIGRGRKELKQA